MLNLSLIEQKSYVNFEFFIKKLPMWEFFFYTEFISTF